MYFRKIKKQLESAGEDVDPEYIIDDKVMEAWEDAWAADEQDNF